MTGYEVAELSNTISKAKAAGVVVLVGPYNSGKRTAAMVQFPGGYIAEIYSSISKQNVSAQAVRQLEEYAGNPHR
jgi:hypothetical protein